MIPQLKPVPNVAGQQLMPATQLLRLQVAYLLEQWAAMQAPPLSWVVDDANDWPTAQELVLPDSVQAALLVNAPNDSKASWGRQEPSFTTTVTVTVQGRLQRFTNKEAQTAIDALRYQVEKAIFTNFDLNQAIQQISSVTTSTDINAEGKYHIGAFNMSLQFEVPEVFDPFVENP